MDFYSSISKHYDFIFPYSPAQVEFVKHFVPTKTKILDIGCGTGNLSKGLNDAGYTIEAIDFDHKMVEKAKERNLNIHFQQMNMLDITKQFKAESFDAIISFGNTLVHLLDNKDIEAFFYSAHKTLKKKGILAIQILNYKNIIENNITSLPLIENDEIKFERHYEFRDDNLINFNTRLTIKEENNNIENSIQLNPIYKETLVKILERVGFSDIEIFGNFKMSKLQNDSIPLIIKGVK